MNHFFISLLPILVVLEIILVMAGLTVIRDMIGESKA